VTDIPGTTRDAVSESTHIHGIPVRLTDTAGIRLSPDRVEQIGIQRSHQAAGDADILLVVLDASQPVTSEDGPLLEKLQRQQGIVVWNKRDLVGPEWEPPSAVVCGPAEGSPPNQVSVSALTGSGIPQLRQTIHGALCWDAAHEQPGIVVTNIRHRDCLTRTRLALEEGRSALRQNLSEEFALYHVRRGLRMLGEITGETTVEEILDKIFSTFCIGK
jgi:tRNA modification GTPase